MDRHIRIKHNADRSTNDAISSISRMADRLTDFNSVNSLVNPAVSAVSQLAHIKLPQNIELQQSQNVSKTQIDDEGDEEMDETEIDVEEDDL